MASINLKSCFKMFSKTNNTYNNTDVLNYLMLHKFEIYIVQIFDIKIFNYL